jgi:SAM-dependent methyltransferase
MPNNTKNHWEQVYTTKQPDEVSWTQEVPKTSLSFIQGFNLPENARIIDIGGGDSKLVDHLLDLGYKNITVLDLSAAALERAKSRLGPKASCVNWVVSDILDFIPAGQYDVWHDRAAFHFLTTADQIQRYVAIAAAAVSGYMVIGTFSPNGPARCSGLDIKQYDETQLQGTLSAAFTKLHSITEDHITPFGTTQNFLFCSFKKNAAGAY